LKQLSYFILWPSNSRFVVHVLNATRIDSLNENPRLPYDRVQEIF